MNGYAALKGAFRDLVQGAGGNVRAARVSRVDGGRISRYGSPQENMHAPIDVIADLEQDVGAPMVTRILADLAGFVLVPRAEAVAAGLNFHQHIADIARTSSATLADLAQAAVNGVDPQEARELLPKITDAETQMAEVKADLLRLAEQNVTPMRRGA